MGRTGNAGVNLLGTHSLSMRLKYGMIRAIGKMVNVCAQRMIGEANTATQQQ